MEKEHYIVEGLSSEYIKTQVKNALEDIDGVNKVCVDLGRGTVEVMYNEPATSEEIRNCIENTGHPIQ
ncbi:MULTISPECIES: heavy-metal-associated domain-containing protein [Clostridium]|uniref:Heavy-metal-associated domain-containing protein n=1 Tax=Clostridium cibarium TaxID=2762247 RepID=A0ABR8PVB9_9CLOT|nr:MULTISPECIES: heavy-metal-associated domain-containing protein [Clostridium]MBD7912125.1 heavy-metal-associated domain-containing protein [Clostridium cibarium]